MTPDPVQYASVHGYHVAGTAACSLESARCSVRAVEPCQGCRPAELSGYPTQHLTLTTPRAVVVCGNRCCVGYCVGGTSQELSRRA
jgi:hypothetical protein